MNTGMSSEARNEFDVKYEDRVQRIREAAAVAIRQLDQLCAARPMTQGVPDAEITRIVQEKLQHRGCGVVVHRGDDGITPFVMRVRGGEIRIRSRLELLPTLQPINSQNGGLPYGSGS
jgi:hypothetical protein